MIIVVVVDCFVDTSNGTSVSANNLVNTLRAKGHVVRVVAPYVNGKDCYSLKERYIPFVTEKSRKQRTHFGLPDRDVLKEAFKGADIIHLFLPFHLEIVGLKIAKEMGIPFISAFHLQPEHITYNLKILSYIPFVNKFIFWLFHFRFYKYSKYIHCPSELIKKELEDNGYKNNLFVISNGFNSSFKILEREKNKEDNFFHIVMTGRYSHEKRQDLLIKAIKLSKYENKIKLHLKGSGPKEKEYKKLSKGLSNEVSFGFVSKEELAILYSKVDLYVHTSDVDGEAIATLEALASGLVPIISNSKLSATKQFALDDRSLFEAGNAKDLARKIDFFIENKHLLESLGEKYAASVSKYDLSSCVDKMIDMYEIVIKSTRST